MVSLVVGDMQRKWRSRVQFPSPCPFNHGVHNLPLPCWSWDRWWGLPVGWLPFNPLYQHFFFPKLWCYIYFTSRLLSHNRDQQAWAPTDFITWGWEPKATIALHISSVNDNGTMRKNVQHNYLYGLFSGLI